MSGSDVAFGSIRENDDVMFRGGQVDLTGLRIHRYLIHRTNTEDLRVWSLNHANGRFFSVRSAAEYEDRLGQRTGHHDLVVSGIVRKIVHGPADQRLLSFERSSGRCIFFRQPGECRDLRMVDSIRHQQLVTLAVIGDRFGFSEFQSNLVDRRAADDTQRSDVSVCVQRKHDCRRIPEIRRPHFTIL